MSQSDKSTDNTLGGFSNYFVTDIAHMVKQEDIPRMVSTQESMLSRMEKTNTKLKTFNELSTLRLPKASSELQKHLRTLTRMKADLDDVFKKIRSLKKGLQNQYTAAFVEAKRLEETSSSQPASRKDKPEDEDESLCTKQEKLDATNMNQTVDENTIALTESAENAQASEMIGQISIGGESLTQSETRTNSQEIVIGSSDTESDATVSLRSTDLPFDKNENSTTNIESIKIENSDTIEKHKATAVAEVSTDSFNKSNADYNVVLSDSANDQLSDKCEVSVSGAEGFPADDVASSEKS